MISIQVAIKQTTGHLQIIHIEYKQQQVVPLATPTDTVAWLDWVLSFTFATEPFQCFLVLSIDLGVESPFYDVAKSRQNGN